MMRFSKIACSLIYQTCVTKAPAQPRFISRKVWRKVCNGLKSQINGLKSQYRERFVNRLKKSKWMDLKIWYGET